jgi:hypothetical protein
MIFSWIVKKLFGRFRKKCDDFSYEGSVVLPKNYSEDVKEWNKARKERIDKLYSKKPKD